jgi:hypothetical protein
MKGLGAWKKVLAGAQSAEAAKERKDSSAGKDGADVGATAAFPPPTISGPTGLLGKLRQTVALAQQVDR